MVTEEQVLSWASDSYYNNADRYVCPTCGCDTMTENDCDHEADSIPVYEDGATKPTDLADAIAWLDDMGEVTFARRAVYE